MEENTERVRVIAEILRLREEQQILKTKQHDMSNNKAELAELYDSVKSKIRTQAARELESLEKERARISKQASDERERIHQDYQTKISHILKRKEESERSLEAESEFLSQAMRNRLETLNKAVCDLRFQLNNQKSDRPDALSSMSPEELLKTKIESNYDQCHEISKMIASTYSEIEGLTFKTERLKSLLEKASREKNRRDSMEDALPDQSPNRRRRFSNVTLHKVRRPSF